MSFITNLLEGSQIPILSAFFLGLMTAISPCPLATNITAIGYISRDFKDRKRIVISGLIYTIGRAITYTAIGLIIYFGASQFSISGFIQQWGEKILGPLLIVTGFFMLGLIRFNIGRTEKLSNKIRQLNKNRHTDVLIMGVLFALAFCPYSGVLYFGMLMPMTLTNASGLYLPVIFAIATGIPVLIFTFIIAYSISSISKYFDRVKVFEYYFRKVVAVLFLGVGIYYTYITLN